VTSPRVSGFKEGRTHEHVSPFGQAGPFGLHTTSATSGRGAAAGRPRHGAYLSATRAIGGFAFAGSYLDRRLGHDVTFRLMGAALGFVVLMFVLYRLAPVFLTPDVAEEVGLR
jgi:hypothetical protein